MRILVRRTAALGDVVLATPVLRRLRLENPDAEIGLQTAYPDVIRNSRHRIVPIKLGVHTPYPWTKEGGLDRLIDLDLAYEKRQNIHIVQAYMLAAFDNIGFAIDWQQELAYEAPAAWPQDRVVAVHAARAGWRNRTLPERTWRDVVSGLRKKGFFPIMVGSRRDAIPGATASFHVEDILAQAGLISRCAAFVGSDSGLLHIAGATGVPIIGVFTSALPEYRLPWRNGKLGHDCLAVLPDISCLGCLHRQTPPVTTESCERGDIACVGRVSADDIVEAVMATVPLPSEAAWSSA